MFPFRMSILIGGILGLLPANAQTVASNVQQLELPAWLAAFPGAHDEHHTIAAEVFSSSYQVPSPPAKVTEHYREQLQKAKVELDIGFDGIGSVIRCSKGREYCVIQIREANVGSSVRVMYSPSAGPPPASGPEQGAAAMPPGTHQVEYVVEGTAGAAGLTYRNAGGGTEQNDVALPTTLHFRATADAFLYISAQKRGAEGTVRVSIRVDGVLTRQSTSSAPYGIATASGKVGDKMEQPHSRM